MSKRTLIRSRAERFEECFQCGYPFDIGEPVLWDDTAAELYCSCNCANCDPGEIDASDCDALDMPVGGRGEL